MRRALNVVGALSNVGARPYQDGAARDLHLAPGVLRDRGLIPRLGAIDMGDVVGPAYHDFIKPAGGVRNEAQVAAYSRALAKRIVTATAQGEFGLVVGGDCSVVLACLLAARHKTGDRLGLVYLDAHADLGASDAGEGDAASNIALALATGRGRSPLATLAGDGRLVDERRIALVGRRDTADEWPADPLLPASQIFEVPSAQLRDDDWLELAAITLERVAGGDVRGFWIQLDVDILNPSVMPAVESPQPGGPKPSELIRFLTPLVRHPKALGLSVTTYDPALDPDRSGARELLRMLEDLLVPSIQH